MNQQWDIFGMPELPYIILCNPNKDPLYFLGVAYETKVTMRFNALGDFEFVFPQSIDGGNTLIEAYDYLENKRLIEVEGYGYFVITDVVEDDDGAMPIKKVSCRSLESELISKRVTAYGGTKKLYDIISPQDTILQDMFDLAPNWSIGTIDGELLTMFRTFNVTDTNIYNFLIDSVSKAFECVFIFDSVNRTISAKTIENATIDTDIFMSFDNLISKASFAEKSDEITTCMAVYGGGNLNIRLVNPLGTDRIYDFSYYANTDWMTAGLVTAVNAWEALVLTQQPIYSALLLQLEGFQGELLTLESTLATFNEEYLALEGVQKARIQANLPYADVTAQMTAKQAQINSQNILISNKQTQITAKTAELQAINTLVSFQTNFTSPQLLELNTFIFENTYKNENIIQTDSMTLVEVQEQAQALYNQARTVLDRVSQPRYEIGMEAVNYILLEDFGVFTNQTELGSVVTAEIKNGVYVQTVLLEIAFDFRDPTDFRMTFSNRVRPDGANYEYAELVGQVVKTGAAVAFDSMKWSNWEDTYKDDVTSFITSALDTTVNNLISNSNQEIIINQNGLRGREFDSTTQNYKPTQVWLTSSILAFTDNAWQTAKLALGQVAVPSGGTAFGLIADVLVGRILAGNSLTIANANNSFTLNGTGATLNNATFSIQTTNSRIFLDPTNGLKIQQNVGGTWTDRFAVTSTGNVTFSGNLSGASGTFSGTIAATVGNIGTLVIDSQGLRTADGVNFLRGNGDFKWGALSMIGGNATFSGNIFANNLQGQVVDGQISSGLNAGKVTNGSMSGNRIFGGNPTVSGLSPSGGSIAINGGLVVNSSTTLGGNLLAGSAQFTGTVFFGSGIQVSGGSGISQTFSVTTPFGTRTLTFSRGVLVAT